MAIKIEADHEMVVETVVALWENWTQQRRPKEQIWHECTLNYLAEIDERKYDGWPWRSKVADTLSQQTADAITADIMNGLFPLNEKYFEVEGLDPKSQQTALQMQNHVENELQRARFIESVRPWVKQLCVIGNAPYLGVWGPVRRPHRRRERRVNPRQRTTSIVVARPDAIPTTKFQSLDAFDVVSDPGALSFEEAPIIWRAQVSRATALTMKNFDAKALEEIEGSGKTGPSETSDALKDRRKRAYGLNDAIGEKRAGEPDEVELLCAFGDLEIDGELFQNQLVVVGNRTVLLRAEEEPFWAGRPIGWGGYDALWYSGYEKGPLEPIRGLQSLVDTFQNQKADILNLIINGAFAYVDDGIIDPDNLWLRPGGMIEVGSLDNLKPLQPSQNVALTYTEIAQLREQGERSSGKSRFDMGQAPGGRRTAFEANLIRAGSTGRANDVLRHVANGPMERYLAWAMGTQQQLHWSRRLVPNEVLLGQYKLNFLGADLTVLRNFQIERLTMLMQIAMQAPPEVTAWVNFEYVWKQLFRALTMDDAHAVNTPAQAQKILKQIAQRERAQQQAQQPTEEPGSDVGGQNASLRSLLEGQAAAA